MAEYQFRKIEQKWQKYWAENQIFKTSDQTEKPKYYILDMFPYPSGAGLHVGHPLGYIATDILARYKRLKGFNVLHPMGYDAFGLPAEQYAIQTGQHPAITTEKNIARYREQLDNIGFSYDWSREIRTSNPDFYKFTQWIFIQLFNHWYNKKSDKAEPISTLFAHFEQYGTESLSVGGVEIEKHFSANDWKSLSEEEKYKISLSFRLAYLAPTTVNWCAELGTVLANEEVKDGVSERGGFPVVKKEMPQWNLRITAYSERLLNDLSLVDWSESIKDQQKNWIGKSKGCEINFPLEGSTQMMKVFTTRPDTIFGVTYMAICPEYDLIDILVKESQKKEVEKYIHATSQRSERERMSNVKTISGVFTGSYCINPLNNEKIPIWIADYVLAGYGTGAVMAVPSSDIRDYQFAKHFHLPIIQVLQGAKTDITQPDFDPKAGKIINSDFLNGLTYQAAMDKAIEVIDTKKFGKGKVNFKIRDSIFSRQRYWGEPIPVYFKNDLPYTLPESELPLILPAVDKYKPTETGEPPLARAKNWKTKEGHKLETNTMPGWAGSSWYFYRYLDPKNAEEWVSQDKINYWKEVDVYLGGAEHATGHLLYSRFWHKFLFDLGKVPVKEYAAKLINQGMIQGRSCLVFKERNSNIVICYQQLEAYAKENVLHTETDFQAIYVDVNLVDSNGQITLKDFKNFRSDLKDAKFEFSINAKGEQVLTCQYLVEKMSKSKYNVVNPDDVVEKYGADTLRLYEMFLGPLEQSKPWNTNNIDGTSRFLRRLWRLFFDESGNFVVTNNEANAAELKVLHKTIKRIEEDIERYSFNTPVSTFMVCLNELIDLKCHKKDILENLLIILSPYSPHIAEELWQAIGHTKSISYATFPKFEEKYLSESEFEYPVSFNGKVRGKQKYATDYSVAQIEKEIQETEIYAKWSEGKPAKKIIVVHNKIINIVM